MREIEWKLILCKPWYLRHSARRVIAKHSKDIRTPEQKQNSRFEHFFNTKKYEEMCDRFSVPKTHIFPVDRSSFTQARIDSIIKELPFESTLSKQVEKADTFTAWMSVLDN